MCVLEVVTEDLLEFHVAAAFARDNIRANYLNPGWNITETEKVVQAKEGQSSPQE